MSIDVGVVFRKSEMHIYCTRVYFSCLSKSELPIRHTCRIYSFIVSIAKTLKLEKNMKQDCQSAVHERQERCLIIMIKAKQDCQSSEFERLSMKKGTSLATGPTSCR